MSLGSRIKQYRKDKGYTQKKLAEETGIAEITIRQYEADKYKPKFEQLVKLAAALDVDEFILAATPSSEFQQEILKRHEEEFIDYLYSLGYTITKIDALNYKVKSDRYNWTTNITKEELDILDKNFSDYCLFLADKYLSEIRERNLKQNV